MEQQPTSTQPSAVPAASPVLKTTKRNFLWIPICIVILILTGAGMFILGVASQKPDSAVVPPTVPTQKPIQPTVADETANWTTYTNDEFHFSFKYPANYEIFKPVGSAVPDGSYQFMDKVKGKAADFFLDVVSSPGTVDAFIKSSTTFDNEMKLETVTVNGVSPLGDKVTAGSANAIWYKYVNHYDQEINPGAVDIISYTAFFVVGDKGFILRSHNEQDNFTEVARIASTFKLADSTQLSGTPPRALWRKYSVTKILRPWLSLCS